MKIIKTTRLRKLQKQAVATGDDQFPSNAPRHDSEGQPVLFRGPSGIDGAEDVKRRWNKKKKRRHKPEEFPKGSI